MRVAFGDIASVESLNFLIALERARERGVEVETTFFKSEDIAAQAVVGGQADIGVGAPYALVERVNAPIRMFYQLSTLSFYPVVNTERYQDWKDLDGQEIAVHSRGSGTEAIMSLMAQRHGIAYGNVSYVPGAEVRAGALLQGTVLATIVDAPAMRLLDQRAPGKFKVLAVDEIDATDEALYANTEYLEANGDAVVTLVGALLETSREINAEPERVTELRQRYGLLADVPEELEAEIVPYFRDAATAGLYPENGGDAASVRDDFAFFSVAGQLQGAPEDLAVEDFWTFEPLDAALERVGRR